MWKKETYICGKRELHTWKRSPAINLLKRLIFLYMKTETHDLSSFANDTFTCEIFHQKKLIYVKKEISICGKRDPYITCNKETCTFIYKKKKPMTKKPMTYPLLQTTPLEVRFFTKRHWFKWETRPICVEKETYTWDLKTPQYLYLEKRTYDCNLLQHTATHCNALQRTSSHI